MTEPLRIQVHPDVRLRIEGYVREDELDERYADLSQRLAEQVEYVTRLRHQLSAAEDTSLALRQETQGLRRQVRQLEHNLEAARKAAAHSIYRADARRHLERLMREPPRP